MIENDTFTLGGHTFSSRFILGSGKYNLDLIRAAVSDAGAQIITLAVRRANTKDSENILDYIPEGVTLLPNTSGARNADEAVRIARLAREMGCGDFVKIEIMHDSKYLLPDNYETIKATEILAKEGFIVMPYMYPDLNAARDLVNAGAASIMPLASPIGSNKGLATKEFIQILIDEIDLPVIVDAGIGKPSQACEAMEMGAAAIMANTAIATAGNIPEMAKAFGLAIEAGRRAYLSGLGRVLNKGGEASDPLTHFFGLPVSTNLIADGTLNQALPVAMPAAISVEPTPVENAPSAPYVQVCESAPIITSPATVSPCSGSSACSIPICPTSK